MTDATYFQARHCAAQWRPFLVALFDRLAAGLPAEEGAQLLRQVGVDMAQQLALGAKGSLAELEQAINGQWQALDWGELQIRSDGKALVLEHRHYPVPYQQGQPSQPAMQALGQVLEGVYSAWLQAQGGDPQVKARLVACDRHGLRFRYGQEEAALA